MKIKEIFNKWTVPALVIYILLILMQLLNYPGELISHPQQLIVILIPSIVIGLIITFAYNLFTSNLKIWQKILYFILMVVGIIIILAIIVGMAFSKAFT